MFSLSVNDSKMDMSEIFSFSANDSKYLMQHKVLLQPQIIHDLFKHSLW
jgi:hypothetical protein